jgi:predicted thioesterase
MVMKRVHVKSYMRKVKGRKTKVRVRAHMAKRKVKVRRRR